ncbi:MAG TPA: hypothetical protein VD741_04190, partial [Solirubrobacterales bacterium]|nr:hypothetical protein [Solirubrobacterales bacterium]
MLRRISVLISLLAVQALISPTFGLAVEADSPAAVNGSQPPPTVSFLDQRPLKVKLSKLEEDEGLKVSIHNGGGIKQLLTLRIRGLEESENPQAQGLLSSKEAFSKGLVEPGGTAEITIPLTNQQAEATGDAAEAELVASGQRGGLARQSVTILFEDKEEGGKSVETPAEKNVLRPERAVAVTLDAVNLLPSPFSRTTSLLLFVAIASILLLLLVRNQMQRWISLLPLVVGVLAFVSVVGAVVALAKGDIWDQPSANSILPRKIKVAEGVDPGNVGTAASKSGKIAQLVVADGELRPVGLEAADSYSGTYDLTPKDEEGSATATINVRDFWIYAVLMIFLGLLLAFSLHRWFETTRPAAKAKRRQEELKRAYDLEIKSYEQRKLPNPALPALSLSPRFERLKADVEEELEEGNAKEAREKLDAMRSYLDRFHLLSEALLVLQARSAQLRELELEKFNRSFEEVDTYRSALLLIGTAPAAVEKERDAEALGAKVGEIEKAADLLGAVVRELQSLLRDLSLVDKLLPWAQVQ